MEPQRLLVFDMMDTVVVDPFFSVLPRRLNLSLEQLSLILNPNAWPAFERGHIDEKTFLKTIYQTVTTPEQANIIKTLPPKKQIRDILTEGYCFISGMENLLEQLKQSNNVMWILSNYPPWFEIVRKTLDLDRFFKGYVLSYHTGARKPEPAAFDGFCKQANVLPPQCFLIDDREKNITAAKSLGMDGVLFENVSLLRGVLKEKGFLAQFGIN